MAIPLLAAIPVACAAIFGGIMGYLRGAKAEEELRKAEEERRKAEVERMMAEEERERRNRQ